MRRKLGRFELAETLSDEYSCFNVVGILFLADGPSHEILRKALDVLQQRHPLLRIKIEKRSRQYYYESQDVPQIPLKIVSRSSDDHWKTITETELNQRLDVVTGPLARCTYVTSQASSTNSELIFTCHHSITDSVALTTIFQDILSISAAAEAGESLDKFPVLPLLPPEEKFFPPTYRGISRRWHTFKFMARQMSDEIRYRKGKRGKRQAPIHLSGQCRILLTDTPIPTTEKIIQNSRNKRISMNSILTAAMLLAVAKILYQGEDLPLRYFTFTNLRPYLKPPVDKGNLGTYHSPVRNTINVKKDQGFWDLALRINLQTIKSFKRGDKFISALMTPVMMRMIIGSKKMRMGTIGLSYPGVLKFESSYGKTRVLGVRGFISNFPLGPEYSGGVWIHKGKIWWDLLYLDTDMDHTKAKEIADTMSHILDSAVQQS